jgi:hypothetical protein
MSRGRSALKHRSQIFTNRLPYFPRMRSSKGPGPTDSARGNRLNQGGMIFPPMQQLLVSNVLVLNVLLARRQRQEHAMNMA